MAPVTTTQAGRTADQVLLDRYEALHAENIHAQWEASHTTGMTGLLSKAAGGFGLGVGAPLLAIGIVQFASLPDVTMGNPMVAATVVGIAVVGALAGALGVHMEGNSAREWAAHTSANVEDMESLVATLPDLGEKLQARRAAAQATVNAKILAESDNTETFVRSTITTSMMTNGSRR